MLVCVEIQLIGGESQRKKSWRNKSLKSFDQAQLMSKKKEDFSQGRVSYWLSVIEISISKPDCFNWIRPKCWCRAVLRRWFLSKRPVYTSEDCGNYRIRSSIDFEDELRQQTFERESRSVLKTSLVPKTITIYASNTPSNYLCSLSENVKNNEVTSVHIFGFFHSCVGFYFSD